MTNDPEELRIALNLVKNIKENNLLIRNLDSIDRILKLYFNQINRNQSEEKLIVNFIFQCIDTYDINASSLFRYLRNSNEKMILFTVFIKIMKKNFLLISSTHFFLRIQMKKLNQTMRKEKYQF